MASVAHAASEAGIHEFIISLPNGYKTQVGEGGQGLSGGQAQRIAIARALVRRPKVLILDEVTSALDVESAEIIRDTIRRLTKQRSIGSADDGSMGGFNGEMAVVIITHNVEMMRIAENVVFLEGGQVVEQGGFEELRRKGGPFARLISGEMARNGERKVVIPLSPVPPVSARNRNYWGRRNRA